MTVFEIVACFEQSLGARIKYLVARYQRGRHVGPQS